MFDNEASPQDFNAPTSLPHTGEQANQWQEANRSWWEHHPMRYDFKTKIPAEEFTKEFYAEIDKRFFRDARDYMPWCKIPFDPLVDFGSLKDKDVLEIGVGNGSHAQLLAQHARSFTGIDLTDYAVKSTTERMRCVGLSAKILRMDAENLQFDDNSFDFIWSWGVIHHSSNTRRILEEMHRVLRPGGNAVTMVYHRSFWHYYVIGGLFHGILRGELLKTKSLHRTVQHSTDGAIARYYSIREWRHLVSDLFKVEDVLVYGSKAEFIPIPGGALKEFIMRLLPNPLMLLFNNHLRMGRFLVSKLEK